MARLLELGVAQAGTHVFSPNWRVSKSGKTVSWRHEPFIVDPRCKGIRVPYRFSGGEPVWSINEETAELLYRLLNHMQMPLQGTPRRIEFRPVDPQTGEVFDYLKLGDYVEDIRQTVFIKSVVSETHGAAKAVYRGYVDAAGFAEERPPLVQEIAEPSMLGWLSATVGVGGRTLETDTDPRFLPVILGFFKVDAGPDTAPAQSFYRDAFVSLMSSSLLIIDRRTPHIPALLFAFDCEGYGFGNFPPIQALDSTTRRMVMASTFGGFKMEGWVKRGNGFKEAVILEYIEKWMKNPAYGKLLITRMVFQALWTLAAMDEIGMVHNDIWFPNVLLAWHTRSMEERPIDGVKPKNYVYRVVHHSSSSHRGFRPDRAVAAAAEATGNPDLHNIQYLFLTLIDFDRGHLTPVSGSRVLPPVGSLYRDGGYIYNFFVDPPESVFAKKDSTGEEDIDHTWPFTTLTDMFTTGLVLLGVILGKSFYSYTARENAQNNTFIQDAFPSKYIRSGNDIMWILKVLHNEVVKAEGVAEWGTPDNLYKIVVMLTAFGLHKGDSEDMQEWTVLRQLMRGLHLPRFRKTTYKFWKFSDPSTDFSYWMAHGGFLWSSPKSPIVKYLSGDEQSAAVLDVLRQMTRLNPTRRRRPLALLLPMTPGADEVAPHRAFAALVDDDAESTGLGSWNLDWTPDVYYYHSA